LLKFNFKKMNVLIVDDHPMTVAGYIHALSLPAFNQFEFTFTKAYDCEQAYSILSKNLAIKHTFDIVLIDKGLPPYEKNGILCGSDLALVVQELMPNCKIMIITAHTEVVIVYDIVKKIRPEAIIIKTDITPEKLQKAVMEIIQGNTYQSPSVKKCINEIWKKELMVEDCNRQILLYLSKGFKIKDLEMVIHLTTSAIQKRVIRMKKVFGVTDDTGLVKEAIKQGFI
jgi:DNA-binding NarL/FixJ family response regulator